MVEQKYWDYQQNPNGSNESPSAAYDGNDNVDNSGSHEDEHEQMGVNSQLQQNSLDENTHGEADSSMNQEEEFIPDPNLQNLDLSGQYIDDLEPLIQLVFVKMPKLRELNLSNNMISVLPADLCQNYLPMLESINLNGNQIPQEEESFSQVVEALSLIGQNNPGQDGSSHSQGLGGLKVLFISLTREDQVDFILRKLPRLEFLNGLAVDREELYSSQEAGIDAAGQNQQLGDDDLAQEQQSMDQIKAEQHEMMSEQDQNNSLVEVMEQKHEMFALKGGSQQDETEQDNHNFEEEHLNGNEPSFQHIADESKQSDQQRKSSNALRHLIDDEHLANAQPQTQLESSTSLSPSQNQNQQIKFKANEYGSFAAHDNQANSAQDEDEDFVSSGLHQREVSQRIDHEVNDQEETNRGVAVQRQTFGQQNENAQRNVQEKVSETESKQEEGEEAEDIELYEVNLLAEESAEDSDDNQRKDQFSPQAEAEGINTDEFEHIAEIYDQIRMLHQQHLFSDRSNQQMKTQIDRNLASYFDTKLKKVMEELALSQNNLAAKDASEDISQAGASEDQKTITENLKKEMSQRSIYQLYMVCAEKIIGLALKDNPDIANVTIQIFKGLSKIQLRYKKMVLKLNQKHAKVVQDLERNQVETQQVLEAAEHLEQNNAANLDKSGKLEATNQNLMLRVAELERERDQQEQKIQQLQKDSRLINHQNQGSYHQQQPTIQQQQQQQQQQQLQTSGQNQIQGQGQAQMRNNSLNLDMPLQQQQHTQVQRPQSALNQKQQPSGVSPRGLSTQNQDMQNVVNNQQQFSGAGPKPQMPAQMQSFQPNSMSARGLPLAQTGFNKSHQNSSGNFQPQLAPGSQSQRSITPSSGSISRKPTGGKFFNKNAANATITQTNTRTLTLRQIRDLINDIYQQKTKFDQKCEENRLPRETMEQFMYTYLNQRYGLKNLIIEWAAAIITGIKQFQKEDHDVALFGKILRSECDEEFRFIQQTVKETVIALLRALFREKYPQKTENTLIAMVDNVLTGKGFIENWQWRRIIEKMYDEDDYRLLESQLNQKLMAQQTQHQQNKSASNERQISGRIRSSSSNIIAGSQQQGKRPMTRSMLSSQSQNIEASKLKFAVFLKCVLDFQLKEHEKFLGYFVNVFKRVDSDRDGILTEEEFRNLMMTIGFSQDGPGAGDFQISRIEKFLQDIDPYSNQKITFSECVQLLSAETVTVPSQESLQLQMQNQLYQQHQNQNDLPNHDEFGDVEYVHIAILEHLSQTNPQMPVTTPQSQASGLSTPAMSNR